MNLVTISIMAILVPIIAFFGKIAKTQTYK